MSRPLYESTADIQNEQQVAQALADRWGCDLAKMPKAYPCDWAFVREGAVVGLAEIKCRKVPSGRYKTLILSLHKWTQLQQFSQHTPAVLVARFDDCIKWAPIDGKPRLVAIGGRQDRGDWQDTEPVIHIPIAEMRTV